MEIKQNENNKKMGSSLKIEKELLIRWIVDAFLRTIAHYGYWLKEVDHQFGMEVALEIEKEVGETSMAIQLRRLASFSTLNYRMVSRRLYIV